MKHLRYFNSLNESHQDGVELIDAIKNTPEGRDLQKIILGHYPFDDSFELKRTGRVYLKNYGSKTFIERSSGGGYSITSLSNGVPFWTEYYNTIPVLLRFAWSNVVSKKISGSGVKKEDVRNWVYNNIPIGSELSSEEIMDMYTESNSIEFLDIRDVEKTDIIKKIKTIFLNDDIIKMNLDPRYQYLDLMLDLGDTIVGNIFKFEANWIARKEMTRGVINLRIEPVSSDSKNSLKVDSYGRSKLKLKKSDNLDKVLEGFILKFIKLVSKYFRDWDFINKVKPEINISDFIISIIEGNSDDAAIKSIENYLEKLAKEGSPEFSKVMSAISKSSDEKILEVYKRIAEKYSSMLKGIAIANRFGGFSS